MMACTVRRRSMCFAWMMVLLGPVVGATAQQAGASAADAKDWPRERLVALLRELAEEAHTKFVVTDPSRRVYGMTYEFVRDGKHTQAFGLDSMHDGAWFMSAMITAHRVDPEGGYLQRVQRYQAPFYVNVLTHSDKLFPNMIPREGQEQFEAPITGWAPRGWDDGPGIDLPTGKPYAAGDFVHPDSTAVERDARGNMQHAYFTSSHHLLQDLADSLMNVWLTTRDPAVARAIMLMHEARMKHGRRIPVVQTAAGLVNEEAELSRRGKAPAFDPADALRPLWQGVVLGEEIRMGHYSDGLAWTYREECARAALSGEPIAEGFVANTIGQTYVASLMTEAFYTPSKYRHGYTLAPNAVILKDGKLTRHHDENVMMFARGIQYAWIAEALLVAYRERPDAWKAAMARLAEDSSLTKLKGGANALAVTFADDPDAVTARLDAWTLGTIDYWAAVREKLGHLPRGCFVDGRNATWVRTAELGAYAHLMKLIAYRLMRMDRVTEWQLIRKQTPAEPLPHKPLPDSVLKLQGLQ